MQNEGFEAPRRSCGQSFYVPLGSRLSLEGLNMGAISGLPLGSKVSTCRECRVGIVGMVLDRYTWTPTLRKITAAHL